MFVLGNFIRASAVVLNTVLDILAFVIFVRIILHWIFALLNPNPYSPVVSFLSTIMNFLTSITEPILEPFRKILPPHKLNGIDLSPILAFLAIQFLKAFLIQSLFQISYRLG